MKTKALHVLKAYFGYQDFRPLQEEIVLSIADGGDTLALLPTGGGKSICFQVPALMQEGICIVVSPLIALMKDQVDNLKQRGVKATAIYSGMQKREIDTLLDNCVYGDIKFLYLSPERLKTDLFVERFKRMNVCMIAVDEAHCISQWGYDFRPPYLEIAALREIHPHVPMIALTASATMEVRKDIIDKLRLKKPNVFVQSFARKNLSYVVRWAENKFEKALDILNKVPGSAIIYVRSRKGTKEIAAQLNRLGVSATFYHAGLDQQKRESRQMEWIKGKVRVMVATNAFGMGIDKPDVRLVVHIEAPENLENYYQEAGRAGRDGIKAFAVLIVQEQDLLLLKEKAEKSYPPEETIKRVYQSLANYYRIAVGSSPMGSYDFDLTDFTQNYQLDPMTTYNVLKVMQEESLVLFTESVFMPSTLHILVDQSKLYETQIAYAKLDPLIKVLLRMYGGELFVNYIKIYESKLAKLLQLSEMEVVRMLEQLDAMGVVAYHARKDKPQVTFLTPRLDARSLPLDKRRIAHRRQQAILKAQRMIGYARNEMNCRTDQILEYFGEHSDHLCGICDVCLKAKREAGHVGDLELIKEKLLRTLQGGKAFSVEELFSRSKLNMDDEGVGILRELEDQEIIHTEMDGKIKLK
ncbi:RecQ family ATP-dependent DNA helicase [Negadavirga shengliensis]|uniref:ATP-dependent DNA helicase RecQ n=1 Tax=Negadavirga shengliensis TaxID=1389218 RepID=A0ABV9T2E2_9BACT